MHCSESINERLPHIARNLCLPPFADEELKLTLGAHVLLKQLRSGLIWSAETAYFLDLSIHDLGDIN